MILFEFRVTVLHHLKFSLGKDFSFPDLSFICQSNVFEVIRINQ